MARAKRELTPDQKQALQQSILAALGEGKDAARSLQDVEASIRVIPEWVDLPRLRFIEEVGRLKAGGLIRAQRKVGYWKMPAGQVPTSGTAEERAADLTPVQKSKESDYYDALSEWLAGRYGCYSEEVSERGKRGQRRAGEALVAVPDVVGVRYFTGPAKDHLELIAVEAKLGKPKRGDLSEAYRYSRFADFCYVAYDEDSLSDDGVLQELLEEATRLGLGVVRFPTRRGPGKRIVELQAPLKQDPDSLAKEVYLSEKLDIWQCARCSTFHVVDDPKRLTKTQRSDFWVTENVLDADDVEASRFICDKCKERI